MYFSDNREKYLGMAEAAAGIGLMLGPVMGAFIYAYVGYMGTFFIFAGVLFLSGCSVYLALPSSLNRNPLRDTES